jgi:tRNA modification GTPase
MAFVCVLTSPNRGAIGVVQVWGAGAVEAADRIFRPARKQGGSLATSPTGRLRLGWIGHGVGDEVVAVVLHGANGESGVEIQCHGGPSAVRLVVEAFVEQGIAYRDAPEYRPGADLDPLQLEAQIDLSQAPTLRTAEILLDQVHGALSHALRIACDGEGGDPPHMTNVLTRIEKQSNLGLRLVSGWRVVISGRPNVGKSALLNGIAGFTRSIVDPTPGTTRDVVTYQSAVDGWPVVFADTAGVRLADDRVEAMGVEAATREHSQADLILLVLDRSEPLLPDDETLRKSCPDALIVVNKIDLPAAWDPAQIFDHPQDFVGVSARLGLGLDELLKRVSQRIVPTPPDPVAAVPFRPGHVAVIQHALACLKAGQVDVARDTVMSLLRQGDRGQALP